MNVVMEQGTSNAAPVNELRAAFVTFYLRERDGEGVRVYVTDLPHEETHREALMRASEMVEVVEAFGSPERARAMKATIEPELGPFDAVNWRRDKQYKAGEWIN